MISCYNYLNSFLLKYLGVVKMNLSWKSPIVYSIIGLYTILFTIIPSKRIKIPLQQRAGAKANYLI